MTLLLSGTNGLSDVDGTAATPAIRGTDANTGMFFPAADTIAFSEGGVEAMRLDANGRLALGATTILGSSNRASFTNDTSAKGVLALQSTSTSGYSAIELYDNSGSQQGAMGWGNASVAVTGAASATYLYSAGAITFLSGGTAERMRLDASGGLILAGSTAQKATGTTWSNPSDQRLKDNIRDYNKGATELMQVRVCEWEYNGKGGTVQGTKGLGVVADEVMAVLPDTVSTYEAKLNTDDEEVTAIKKFDATEITWLLVKTVQEQQAMIEQLKADVAALKGTV
jgi:hypothetical protein